MRILATLLLLIQFTSCKQWERLSAQQIIDRTIANAGGQNYEEATITFTFRNIMYGSKRHDGEFELTRTQTDSLGETWDVLTNNGFERFVNGNKIILPDSTAVKYANSVNSVHYFVQLPYGLNDPAVKKVLVGETQIAGKPYFEIAVSFAQEGGGTDHEDEYMYWINKNDFTVDYFAYKFYTDKGGIRFRKAYNPRRINGIGFVDYENYKIEPWQSVDLKTLGALYEAGKLELLSKIETKAISVVFENNSQ